MDIKNDENHGNEKLPFRIKSPSEGPVKMPFPIPEAMRSSWLFQNRVRLIIIVVVVIGLAFAAKMVMGHFKAAKPSLSDTMKQQQQAAKDAPVAVKGFKVGRFNYEDSMNVLGTIKGAMELKLIIDSSFN